MKVRLRGAFRQADLDIQDQAIQKHHNFRRFYQGGLAQQSEWRLQFRRHAFFSRAGVDDTMDIRFISSLTAEDENVFAPALLKAIGALLDQFPIAYTLRIETTGSQVFQHSPATTRTATEPHPAPTGVRGGTNGTVIRALSARYSDGN
jgi:hypothetical protein